jgi:hypothetical protein
MEIVEYSSEKAQEWDEFVKNNKDTWVDSQSHWLSYFEKKFKYKNYSFMLYNSKKLIGVFPLFLAKSLLFGKRLISGPVLDRGGFFGEVDDYSLINKHLNELGKKLEVKYIEVRAPPKEMPNFVKGQEYVDFCLDLNIGVDDLWKGMNKKLRNGIRRAQKDIKVEKVSDLKKFYNLYSRTMSELGSPPIGIDFFEEAKKDGTFVLLAKYKEKIIGVVIVFLFRNEAKYESAGYIPKYRNLQANSLLVFEAIKECKKQGFSKFIFGRTIKDSSVHTFKKRWNVPEIPLTYYYKMFKGEVPKDLRGSLLAKISKKIWNLMPLFISKKIGKYFRRMVAM